MSWIADLADKAENILNKIDQNAATKLQVTTGAEGGMPVIPVVTNTLDTMRKNLSSSTQSLKATFSPTKTPVAPGDRSVRSESGFETAMTSNRSLEDKVEWQLGGNAITSRRNSSSSKAESVTIDMENNDGAVKSKDLSDSSPDKQELNAFKIALSAVRNERDELRHRLSALNRDIENEALRERVQTLEELTQHLTEERDQAQQELGAAQTASNNYIHSISELETNLAKIQQEYLEMAQKLQMQMKESAHQRQELQDYRLKAQRALQTKDNLIAELKRSGGATGAQTATDSELRLLQTEYDALKVEHQQLLVDQNKFALQLEEARKEIERLSSQHTEQTQALRLTEEALRRELRAEREHNLASESEQRVLTQELQTLRQQLSNQMAAAATRLQEKEQQLQQLRMEKTSVRNINDESLGDYDARIRTLTEALVAKQIAVENVTAERNALRIQLEKVQDQLLHPNYNNKGTSPRSPRNTLLSNYTDDVKAQFPLLMKENPFDNRVARRVKRAYTSLDSAGIRLGAFLRRYPLMRIFVLMYVGLLHMWVFFILFSSIK